MTDAIAIAHPLSLMLLLALALALTYALLLLLLVLVLVLVLVLAIFVAVCLRWSFSHWIGNRRWRTNQIGTWGQQVGRNGMMHQIGIQRGSWAISEPGAGAR